jgi:c-di-GMP-binding flagellar brake protein YcgR
MHDSNEVPEGEPIALSTEPGQGAEGRKFVRYPVKLPCQFSSDHSSGGGQVVDLSTGGCKVESDWRHAPGEYLCMNLQFLAPDRPVAIALAVVRWSREQAFGVEFIRMEPVQQERLRLLVQYIEKDATL